MDISMVIIIGLPVLYATGSLKKIVNNSGVGGRCFVLYFVGAAGLSLLPNIAITSQVSLNAAGVFFCLAPALYLAVKKAYTCRFYIAFIIVTLLSVITTLVFNTYTIASLPHIIIGVVSLASLILFRARAPVFAPVLMGVFYAAKSMIQFFTDMYMDAFFDSMGAMASSIVICMFIAYLTVKRRGRHAAQGKHNKRSATKGSVPIKNKI